MRSTADFDLRVGALQLLDGDDPWLSAAHCSFTCLVSCSTECFNSTLG